MKNNFNLNQEICPVCGNKLLLIKETYTNLFSCQIKESETLSIYHNHFYFRQLSESEQITLIYFQLNDQIMIIDSHISIYQYSNRVALFSFNLKDIGDFTLNLYDSHVFDKLQTLINFQ